MDRCDTTEEELITERSLLSEKKSSSDGQTGLFRASCLGFRTGGTDKEFNVGSGGGQGQAKTIQTRLFKVVRWTYGGFKNSWWFSQWSCPQPPCVRVRMCACVRACVRAYPGFPV